MKLYLYIMNIINKSKKHNDEYFEKYGEKPWDW